MRYFAHISYKGSAYSGWQRQPNSISVQEIIEKAMSTLMRREVEILGCGRTDAGVHALDFYYHFEYDRKLAVDFVRRLNRLLPADISVFEIFAVHSGAHARFDAVNRSYEYRITTRKNPFLIDTAYYLHNHLNADRDLLVMAAELLLGYRDFAPFCKSKTDALTRTCLLRESRWTFLEDQDLWIYRISADRFLRGMVRLIVGMCIRVAQAKISIKDVEQSLEKQKILKGSWSAPAHGLFLTGVEYPFIKRSPRTGKAETFPSAC